MGLQPLSIGGTEAGGKLREKNCSGLVLKILMGYLGVGGAVALVCSSYSFSNAQYVHSGVRYGATEMLGTFPVTMYP